MSKRTNSSAHLRNLLLASSACAAFVSVGGPASAQNSSAPAASAPVEKVTVTGSRIPRKNYTSNSPISTASFEQVVGNANVSIETYLNTIPSVNPGLTSTSNNPGAGGAAYFDLRGLGLNRTVTLIDGRRPMVADNTLAVDTQTIPLGLIDRIEVITGGAGAVYGADAIAGAVNIVLRKNFDGFQARATYSNSTEFWDEKEWQAMALYGVNSADGRGNIAFSIERATREGMIKNQRPFSTFATASTNSLPEGLYNHGFNAPTQAGYDALFALPSHGSNAPGTVINGNGRFAFNANGTAFYRGIFNNPSNVVNFQYPIDQSVNQRLFPDVYAFNFDAVNILTLPYQRTAFLSKGHYELGAGVEAYGQFGWTKYTSAVALAPTPVTSRAVKNTLDATVTATQVRSPLVTLGKSVTALIVPVTNPFVPTDFRTLVLGSRVGDDPNLIGSGATEPFLMSSRILSAGRRQTQNTNETIQYLVGLRGPVASTTWEWDAYLMEGHSSNTNVQTGSVNAQRMQQMLEAPDGGVSLCAGGFNPFGRHELSASCVSFLSANGPQTKSFDMNIAQATAGGELFDLPAGPVQLVVGGEIRQFEYKFDPGPALGPVNGFNVQAVEGGKTEFKDAFFEALFPIVTDAPLAKSLEIGIGYRYSLNDFENFFPAPGEVDPAETASEAYKAEASWALDDSIRARASFQHSVRAPNFGELFAGGSSFPQFFDPCSEGTNFRITTGAAGRALCLATNATPMPGFVSLPGLQLLITYTGNTSLKPEQADTYTFGLVLQNLADDGIFERLRGSIDYWSIEIDNPISAPGVNVTLAQCYNYYGNNPTLSATHPACTAFRRSAGTSTLGNPVTGDPNGSYNLINAGSIATAGVDIQALWGIDLDELDMPASWGSLDFSFLATRLLYWRSKDIDEGGYPEVDYTGTVSFFGAGNSQSFPIWKINMGVNYEVDDYMLDLRARYISGMENRASVIFPGEAAQFTGPPAVWYFDAVATWDVMEQLELRLGINNLFDKQPPEFRPNQQSGTDPSLYDVVGRRVFTQVNLKF